MEILFEDDHETSLNALKLVCLLGLNAVEHFAIVILFLLMESVM